jgi:hypothetical protein
MHYTREQIYQSIDKSNDWLIKGFKTLVLMKLYDEVDAKFFEEIATYKRIDNYILITILRNKILNKYVDDLLHIANGRTE